MRGKIVLTTRKGKKLKNGNYPVVCFLTNYGKQISFSMKMNFSKDDWDFEIHEPLNCKRSQLIIRKKKSILNELLLRSLDDYSIDFDFIKVNLLGGVLIPKKDTVDTCEDFFDFAFKYANEKRNYNNSLNLQKLGNAKVYDNALKQFRKTVGDIALEDIDYSMLASFKNYQLSIGNKNTTVSTYLRTLKAIYNEALKRYSYAPKSYPFDGILRGVSSKLNRTQKRNVSIITIKILESLLNSLVKGQNECISLFLLQFYFGGQDLFDIYYLTKNQFSIDDRIYFRRGKLGDNGYEFDLKIVDKAKNILKNYNSKDHFLFPWRKDFVGYNNFRSRYNKNLNIVKSLYNNHVGRIEKVFDKKFHRIEVKPLDGRLTSKVARHTFATVGSRFYIDPDMLRTLMGHERSDVDTIYKDTYPEKERDKFLNKIINTSNINEVTLFIFKHEKVINNKRIIDYKYLKDKPNENFIKCSVTGLIFKEPKHFKVIHLVEQDIL